MDVLIRNGAAEKLAMEAREAQEAIVGLRLENERRFGTPIGACPWGCDGSGWNPLAGYIHPHIEIEIYHDGKWLTPCECNMISVYIHGVCYRWPRSYPMDYGGPRVDPP